MLQGICFKRSYGNSCFNDLVKIQHSILCPFLPGVVFLATALWSEIIFIEVRAGRRHLTYTDTIQKIEINDLWAIQTKAGGYRIYYAPDLVNVPQAGEKYFQDSVKILFLKNDIYWAMKMFISYQFT